MKINAAQFVCIINLQGAPVGGRRIGHRRYFKHSWLLCKIDRKFQLFADKPVRDPGAIRSGTYYLRINAITRVDRAVDVATVAAAASAAAAECDGGASSWVSFFDNRAR